MPDLTGEPDREAERLRTLQGEQTCTTQREHADELIHLNSGRTRDGYFAKKSVSKATSWDTKEYEQRVQWKAFSGKDPRQHLEMAAQSNGWVRPDMGNVYMSAGKKRTRHE